MQIHLFFLSFALAVCLPLSSPANESKHILIVLPHPDDETMIRSFITRFVEAGNSVSAIYLTRGEGGRDRHWGDQKFLGEEQKKKSLELANTRVHELDVAGRAYGFKNLNELKFPDDPLRDPVSHIPTRDASCFLSEYGPWKMQEIKSKIEAIAQKEKPDLVITFFPAQVETHAHHQATALIVKQVFEDGGFGPNAEGLFGFYEEKEASGAKTTIAKSSERVEFSPKLISRKKGPHFGKSYGELGTKAALAYDSQMKDLTEKFLRNWMDNPNEVIAPIESKRGLSPVLEALGPVDGVQVYP